MTTRFTIIAASLIIFSVYLAGYSSPFQLVESSSGHHKHIGRGTNNFFSSSPSIAICCAWDNKFSDEQLTYMIVGGDDPSRQAVVEAINQWVSSVNGLRFAQVSDKNTADMVINFQNVGGSAGGSEKHTNGLGTIRGSAHVDIVGETIL